MRVITTTWQAHKLPIQRIREIVFINEQKVPQELEWDDEDTAATHYLVLNDKHQAVATARLTKKGQLGRMAVLKHHRNQGIAHNLLSKIVSDAKENNLASIHLHSQTYIQPLYEAAGFVSSGDVFSEAGIPHIKMILDLREKTHEFAPANKSTAIATNSNRADTTPHNAESSTANDEPFVLSHIEEFKEAVIKLAAAAQYTVKILTPDLEPELYDHESFTDLISAFCRSHRHASVQILISGEPRNVSSSHQLVQLAQRLPSSMTIKQIKPGYQKPEGAFMVVDRNSIMHRNRTTEYKGFASLNNAAQNRIKTHYFEQHWTHAVTISEFRRLGI